MMATRFDTAHFWWFVHFDRQGRRTGATVKGHPYTVARPMGGPIEKGRDPRFSFTDSNRSALMARVRTEIERLDGSILKGNTDHDDG